MLAAALLIISEFAAFGGGLIFLEGLGNRKTVYAVKGRVGEKFKTRSRARKKMEFSWVAEKISLLQALPVG